MSQFDNDYHKVRAWVSGNLTNINQRRRKRGQRKELTGKDTDQIIFKRLCAHSFSWTKVFAATNEDMAARVAENKVRLGFEVPSWARVSIENKATTSVHWQQVRDALRRRGF